MRSTLQNREERHERQKPGVHGTGEYYRIIVRPKSEFVLFRIQDVGRKGHAERLAGLKENGHWDTHAWLISKRDAHIERGKLVADEPQTRKILNNLSTTPKHVKGDIFEAKDRKTSKYKKSKKR